MKDVFKYYFFVGAGFTTGAYLVISWLRYIGKAINYVIGLVV